MFSKVDLARLGPAFEIPVFIIHGAEDLVARLEVAKRYFDSINAPQKDFVDVQSAGHDPNKAMIDAHYRVVSERIGPLRD
jgi:pimeloyl-ACP methyl ester carboxylesterase